jgi:hypothetical protein
MAFCCPEGNAGDMMPQRSISQDNKKHENVWAHQTSICPLEFPFSNNFDSEHSGWQTCYINAHMAISLLHANVLHDVTLSRTELWAKRVLISHLRHIHLCGSDCWAGWKLLKCASWDLGNDTNWPSKGSRRGRAENRCNKSKNYKLLNKVAITFRKNEVKWISLITLRWSAD